MVCTRSRDWSSFEMRTFRLNFLEREFLRTIINETLNVVQMQDRKKCCEYARCAIVGDKHMLVRAAAVLRPVVLAKIQTAGHMFFKRLLDRNTTYLSLPKPLRGKALDARGSVKFRAGHACRNGEGRRRNTSR